MKLIIFTDGASRGNPGPAAYGFTISDEAGKLIAEVGEYIGETTNNVAEYTAVLKAFQKVKELLRSNKLRLFKSRIEIDLFADSKLVAEQLSGKWKIKHPNLKELFSQIKFLEMEIGSVRYTHVYRDKNTEADRLANQALDKL